MKIALIQPLIPNYRESFFSTLTSHYDIDFFVYENIVDSEKKYILKSTIPVHPLKINYIIGKIFFYPFCQFFKQKYDLVIFPAEIRSVSTWILLLLFKLKKTKTILWGHGISIVHYLKEEKKYPLIRRIFHSFASLIWLYTDKEKGIVTRYLNKEKVITLTNTIDLKSPNFSNDSQAMNKLKIKYNISTKFNFLYSARFNTKYRRIDLLLKIIEKLDKSKFGFIIIGDGPFKPDFSQYSNVYEFGAIYDRNIKNELFAIADLYIQPAWLGLSAAEALLYGKPVLTFKRSAEILQGVEYSYVHSHVNGFIAENLEDMLHFIKTLDYSKLSALQVNAKEYASSHLKSDRMVSIAIESINGLLR